MDDTITIKYNTTEAPIKESYKVGADGIYFCRDYGNGTEITRLIIPKEAFVMAYKTYILGSTESGK